MAADHLPARLLEDLGRFQRDSATFKVDWALDGPVPWSAEPARRAATVHVTESVDALTIASSEMARGLVPSHPFLLLGQQSVPDPTRAPTGKATLYGYTHIPREVRGDAGERSPGRGVHGAPGANAARAAVAGDRRRRLVSLVRRGGGRG